MDQVKTLRVNRRLVLASTSPRRIDLLKQLRLSFDVENPGEAENSDSRDAESRVRQNATMKCRAVASSIDDGIVVAADTIVLLDNQILEKPLDAKDAYRMLKILSGKVHEVVSAVTLIDTFSEREDTRVIKTKVKIRDLTDLQIESYVATGEPLDKAGAYAAQGLGSILIEWVDGCFYNVVGLPLSLLYDQLKSAGLDILVISN